MHFVIIGNGVAGITAARAIRERERRAEITVISGESEYFFSRTALMYAYMDKLTLEELEPHERKVYRRQNIHLVLDWVTDLDAGRQTLTLQSGNTVRYDRMLLATGSAANRSDWKGLDSAREGVVNFVSLQDLQECERLTPSTRQAVVVGGGLIGVELVECLNFHGKQVTFLVREPWYFPVALGGKEAEMISDHIRRHGVDLRTNEEVSELCVDSRSGVSSIKTKAGSEFPCQMLGICVGVRPAIDWLRNVRTPPELGRGIVVNGSFATSLPNVWGAGDCAEIHKDGPVKFVEQIWYSARRQGELAARSMLGDSINYQPPVFFNSSKFFEIEFTTVGEVTKAPKGSRGFYKRVPGRDVSIRIVEFNGAVIGFNMLGSRWNHNYFERWILEHRSLDYVMEHLQEAQFDVEFGRQDLGPVMEDYERFKRKEVVGC